MTPVYAVHATAHYERISAKMKRDHRAFAAAEKTAIAILGGDPFNRSRSNNIKKLRDIAAGDGQYRLALARWRFRFDVEDTVVILKHCGLRREDTY